MFEAAVADVYGIRHATADIIVDVGANIGAFSCLAAWTHPQARVYAFEPNPNAVRQARLNFRLNGLENVHLTEAPVTGDGREVVIHIGDELGSASIFVMGSGQKVSMRSVSLDVVSCGQAESIFFKLDCEGVEAEVIEWMVTHRDRLPSRITLVCEYHPWCPRPVAETLQILKSGGFQAESRIEFGSMYVFASR